MTTGTIHTELKREIIRAFAVIDEWFDREPALLTHRSPNGGNSVIELLERTVHANGYLLDHDGVLPRIDQSIEKEMADHWLSILLLNDLSSTAGQCFDPASGRDSKRIRYEFREQLDLCICTLELLMHAAGDADQPLGTDRIEFYQRISFMVVYMKCQAQNLLNLAKQFEGEVCER